MLNLLGLLLCIVLVVFLTVSICALFKTWKARFICLIMILCTIIISSSIAEIIIKIAFLNE